MDSKKVDLSTKNLKDMYSGTSKYVVEILGIVDKEMLPILNLLDKKPWHSEFLWNSGRFATDGRVHYIKISLYLLIERDLRRLARLR